MPALINFLVLFHYSQGKVTHLRLVVRDEEVRILFVALSSVTLQLGEHKVLLLLDELAREERIKDNSVDLLVDSRQSLLVNFMQLPFAQLLLLALMVFIVV